MRTWQVVLRFKWPQARTVKAVPKDESSPGVTDEAEHAPAGTVSDVQRDNEGTGRHNNVKPDGGEGPGFFAHALFCPVSGCDIEWAWLCYSVMRQRQKK